MKIAIITSLFNREITEGLEKGAYSKLLEKGIKESQITALHVPGAVEIPLACRWILDKNFDGVIALGAVIRGETSHYDFVCNSVERGISNLMLETKKPIAFGVLTTENEEQAWDRVKGAHGNKGADAAETLLHMLHLKEQIQRA